VVCEVSEVSVVCEVSEVSLSEVCEVSLSEVSEVCEVVKAAHTVCTSAQCFRRSGAVRGQRALPSPRNFAIFVGKSPAQTDI